MNNKENNIKNINNEEIKLVCFAIKEITKRYPNNSKIYASLISTFFLSKRNEKLIYSNFKDYMPFEKGRVYDVLDYLNELQIINLFIGSKGAKYIYLNDINYLKFIEEYTENYDKIDLKVILFALECLEKQYPNNNGNIYLSNLNTFFKDKRNNALLLKKFSKTYHYNKDIILEMVDMLANAEIISKNIGPKGGIIIRLILKEKYNKENAIIKILETLNGKCSFSTLEGIVFNKEKDISPYYIDTYYEHLDLFKNEDEQSSSISFLKDHRYVAVEGSIIKLTYQGDENSL